MYKPSKNLRKKKFQTKPNTETDAKQPKDLHTLINIHAERRQKGNTKPSPVQGEP